MSTEFYDYIKFFEVSDSMIFHNNDNVKRYARFHLNLTLKFMGCKSVHARQIANTIFEQFERCRVVAYANHQEQVHKVDGSDVEKIFCVSVLRSTFYYIVGHILSTYQYSKPQYISDFPVACDVQEKKHSFTILLGGTSGCGKSTLTALLASRIGFAAVISTDNIRQVMRKFISRAESPILWASTYHAGEIISDPSLSHKEKILQGYEAQNEMIFNKLDVLIEHYERKKESLIVEGVHLDTRLIVRLVKKHPSCIPFLMYISNEAKHKERFAIRSKYMTLDPHQNKYTKYFKNIRIINDHLCHGADSIMIQHQFWSSKGMLRLIRKKRYSVGQGNQTHVENEETFNSDDDDEDEDEKLKKEQASSVKSHSREKNMSSNTNPSDSESDSESREDRIDFYLDCGSLGS
eukprot:gene12360-14500_t